MTILIAKYLKLDQIRDNQSHYKNLKLDQIKSNQSHCKNFKSGQIKRLYKRWSLLLQKIKNHVKSKATNLIEIKLKGTKLNAKILKLNQFKVVDLVQVKLKKNLKIKSIQKQPTLSRGKSAATILNKKF